MDNRIGLASLATMLALASAACTSTKQTSIATLIAPSQGAPAPAATQVSIGEAGARVQTAAPRAPVTGVLAAGGNVLLPLQLIQTSFAGGVVGPAIASIGQGLESPAIGQLATGTLLQVGPAGALPTTGVANQTTAPFVGASIAAEVAAPAPLQPVAGASPVPTVQGGATLVAPPGAAAVTTTLVTGGFLGPNPTGATVGAVLTTGGGQSPVPPLAPIMAPVTGVIAPTIGGVTPAPLPGLPGLP